MARNIYKNVVQAKIMSLENVKHYNVYADKFNNFSHGRIELNHEITALEKLEIMDALNEVFLGKLAGQRFGTVLAIWDETKFRRVRLVNTTLEFIK